MPSQEEINDQLTLLATHRRTLAHYIRQQSLFGMAYVPPAIVSGIQEARGEIQRIKRILQAWQVSADHHPDDDPPAQMTQSISESLPVDRVRLRQAITELFNDEELRDLCFDISIEYENLSGGNKAGKVRELVGFAERHGKFQILIAQIRILRPQASW